MSDYKKQIALILDTNQAYDRKVVSGVTRYMRQVGNWSLHMELDPKSKIPNFQDWKGHGVIADLDDLDVYKTVSELEIPVVGIGGGYGFYPKFKDIPYVYTDNEKVVDLAFEHLRGKGFNNLAFCGIEPDQINGWARERQLGFEKLCRENNLNCSTYIGKAISNRNWNSVIRDLKTWLEKLPKPVGIMAANDMRAYHVLEACLRSGLSVPDQVAVVGVDNDEMVCSLTNPPLTSVIQGTDMLGFYAAEILDKMMNGESSVQSRVIPPQGIAVRESSDSHVIDDDLIFRALGFIRDRACSGIRVDQVAQYCHVSRSTLENRFKQKLGKSVHNEITRLQINKVKDLLIQDEMPLKHISRITGFSSPQYMSIKLKEDTGLSPMQYRMKHRNLA